VERVLLRDGQVIGVQVNGEEMIHDRVVSTAPLPDVSRFARDLPPGDLRRIGAIANIGVVCPVFKLSRRLTQNFWLNTNDPEMAIPGLIEYSNLKPLPYAIVYVPFYLPGKHEKFTAPDDVILGECQSYFARLNRDFRPDWVLAAKVSRYRYAQTVCAPGFFRMLPPMRSRLPGFFMADTAYYYPEDRSITESVAVGKALAALAMAPA
jgi:protoporphyrinogen oxidase